jgi:hypothetical protein
MKALTIKQPWAHLIITGQKDIENRTWTTSYRGPVLIHAGKALDEIAYDVMRSEEDVDLPHDRYLDRGGFVGVAWLADCVTRSDSDWFEGPYGFVLTGVRRCQFYPCKGALGLWNVPETVFIN